MIHLRICLLVYFFLGERSIDVREEYQSAASRPHPNQGLNVQPFGCAGLRPARPRPGLRADVQTGNSPASSTESVRGQSPLGPLHFVGADPSTAFVQTLFPRVMKPEKVSHGAEGFLPAAPVREPPLQAARAQPAPALDGVGLGARRRVPVPPCGCCGVRCQGPSPAPGVRAGCHFVPATGAPVSLPQGRGLAGPCNTTQRAARRGVLPSPPQAAHGAFLSP